MSREFCIFDDFDLKNTS